MLLHAIAPSRDFTQIANSLVWDDELSDSAFRLLVRALALGPAKARATTVTALAAGLSGGRVTTDRARRQLARAGLLHTTRRRGAAGQVRTESLLSSVPLGAAEAERLFDGQFERVGRSGHGVPPDAGKRSRGSSSVRSSGTALPGVTPRVNTTPLPPPPALEPAGTWGEFTEHGFGEGGSTEAERALLELRRIDPRLTLGAREVRRLAPLAAEWLARGVSSAALRAALTSGLPDQVKSPAALVRWRLEGKMPAPLEPSTVTAPVCCDSCDRAFRPVNGEHRCGDCRTRAAARTAASTAHTAESAPGTSRRVDWRTLVAQIGAATG
ncbi:hypothetical protein ABT263_35285 [Kitasatospora sp. NPDC001603]|uniref:hypothetical protein n=1 Tax=Kitasatospora sp. NPDC001603 TaxID=3154388 RepID=UPI00331FFD07